MARGFMSGLIWGGVASVGVVGALSLMMPLPLPPQVGDAAPGAGAAPARIRLTDVAEQDRLPETPPASTRAVPRADVPQQDDLAAVDADIQTSAGLPETGAAEGLSTPLAPEGETPAQPGAEDPVLPNPQAMAPQEPQPIEELSISTEPAQPPAPEVAAIEGAFDAPSGMQPPAVEAAEPITLPAQEQLPEEQTAVTPIEAEAVETPEAATPTTRADPAPETMVEEPLAPQAPTPDVETAALSTSPTEGPDDAAETTSEPAPDPEEDVAVEAAQSQAPQSTLRPPEAEQPQEDNAETETRPESDSEDSRLAIGTPATRLTDRDSGVVINRPGAAETETTAPEPPAAEADPRPLMTNRVAVEVAPGEPLMSVVLIDDGTTVSTGPAGLAALRSFPYPLTFAVDSSLPDAADRVARYRAAGFEVLAMIDLPQGAQPSDAETTFAATLDRIGAVVGVLEGPTGRMQDSRALADQVTDILAQSGHGLVTQDKGLNTMPKLARKSGVPADPVFRDFDSKGQSARVIRRFLDQAAFKAGQEGAVIMLGRLRPDTVSALLLWGLQDRASDVALVPVSTVLLREE